MQQIHISMASCQKGSTRHAYAWQIGPFWQDTLDFFKCINLRVMSMPRATAINIAIDDVNVFLCIEKTFSAQRTVHS